MSRVTVNQLLAQAAAAKQHGAHSHNASTGNTVSSTQSFMPPAAPSAANADNASALTQQQWGVSPPISTEPPTESDLYITTQLRAVLQHSGPTLEAEEEESRRRESVLGTLNEMLREYVKVESIKQGMGEGQASEVGCRLFTFGSCTYIYLAISTTSSSCITWRYSCQ